MNNILVTGSCGTIGRQLVKSLVKIYPKAKILCLDNNETGLFFLNRKYESYDNVKTLIADVRDNDRLKNVTSDMDIIFHLAALKHVEICENSPLDSVQTNIVGTDNIINAALYNNVKKVIFTSSDKAVNPTNVMGSSKLTAERIISSYHNIYKSKGFIFCSTRFGNVLGSSGSVVPVFIKQIKDGGPITLTHPEMTRFIMSTEQAVDLVIKSSKIAKGGEVFVTKMPAVNIRGIAVALINLYSTDRDIKIEVIGPRLGEKMYEELMSEEETKRAIEIDDFFVILNPFEKKNDLLGNYKSIKNAIVENPYISKNENLLDTKSIEKFLENIGNNNL